MKRFHCNIGSRDAALQKRPEVLHAVSVYATINVLNRMVDDLMFVFAFQAAIAAKFISEESGSSFYVPLDDGVQGGFNAIRDNLSANAPAALQHSHDDDLVSRRLPLSGDAASLYALVHVSRFSADEGFVCLDFATEFRAESFILHRKANPMQHVPCRLLIYLHISRTHVATP